MKQQLRVARCATRHVDPVLSSKAPAFMPREVYESAPDNPAILDAARTKGPSRARAAGVFIATRRPVNRLQATTRAGAGRESIPAHVRTTTLSPYP